MSTAAAATGIKCSHSRPCASSVMASRRTNPELDPDVPHVAVTVAKEHFYEGASHVLAAIRPDWPVGDITYKSFKDGITNTLVCCSRKSSPDQIVLIRVYGEKTDLLIDRQAEIRNIKMLQNVNFAPILYATFNNGLAYEYAPGVTLTTATVQDPEVYPLVARRLAELHAVAVPSSVQAGLWVSLKKFLGLAAPSAAEAALRFARGPTSYLLGDCASAIDTLGCELAELEDSLSGSGSPVVMCHNDLLLANVILDLSEGKVTFIDYEYAGHNYQAFDIGNHFAEFAGVATVDYSLYPEKDLQLKWLRVYLKELRILGGPGGHGGLGETKREGDDADEEIDEAVVENLFIQVNKFALCSHFMWALWALVQAEHSSIDFDFQQYAGIRLKEYYEKKELFLSLQPTS